MRLLVAAQLEMAGYVTSTGSSWAGNVETARFTVLTEPFERYLNHRGWTEQDANPIFPVRYPWWFRQVTPTGWQAVKGGVQWSYKDFKPKDPITIDV
jgi:hypothetical protein